MFMLLFNTAALAKSLNTDDAVTLTKIQITVMDIYTDVDKGWLYTFANDYHIKTQESVIVALLPMKVGDTVSSAQLIEAERLLREKTYFRDAKLNLTEEGILNVVVFDNWTLFLTYDFSRDGGENSSDIGIRDTNFLGLGIATILKFRKDYEKSGYRFRITSPIHWIKFSTINLILENYDIGEVKSLVYEKPFYTSTSENMFYSYFNLSDIDNTFYQNDLEIGTARNKSTDLAYSYGWLNELVGDTSYRTQVGVSSFSQELMSYSDISLARLFDIREKNYIWWGNQRYQNQYEVVKNIYLMRNKEDINLGLQSNYTIGLGNISFVESPENLLPEQLQNYYLNQTEKKQSLMFKFNYEASVGFRLDDTLILQQLALNAEIYEKRSLDHYYTANYELDIFQPINQHYTLYNGNKISYVSDFRNAPHSLGAEDGLRGYPIQYLYGRKIWLSTLELRYYSELELWDTLAFAWVGFYDIGRVWDNISTENAEKNTLSTVGIGLRIFPFITSGNNVIHIDLAKPNSANTEIGQWEWRLQIRSSF